MKLFHIAIVLLMFSFSAVGQTDKSITIGKKEVIQSKVLEESRTIWVYTPNTTSLEPNPSKRYPVVYVLDGSAHFFSTVGIIQQLSQANGNGVLPEMIIVAIENTNRLRDLVPSADLAKRNKFLDFLSEELVPYVDRNYNTAPYRVLVGHSLGGLTALDVLAGSSALFNAYIAIDPSLWYNDEKILNTIVSRLSKQQMKGRTLFIASANTLPRGMDLSQLEKDKSPETQHLRSISKFIDFLKTNSNGLRNKQKYYEAERHNTVPLISEYDGLRFIFDYFHLDLAEKDFLDPTAALASKLKTHYAVVTEKLGYKNAPPESLINYLAYEAMGKKQFEKAQALFQLNIENYPKSSNAYDSYGDYFLARNEIPNAIANYEKVLQIKDIPETRRKLESITSKTRNSASTTADLERYAGVYVLDTYNIPVILEVRAGSLWAKVSGQEDDELLFLSENVFTVKGKQGYKITIQIEGGKPIGFTSVQPNGTFKATFKNR